MNLNNTASVCQAQYDAIIAIKSTNDKLHDIYDIKIKEYNQKYKDWQDNHIKWQEDYNLYSTQVSDKSNWIELNGSAFNCSTLKEDSIICCRDSNLKRKKCTVQGKGGSVKCSNTGACKWFNNNGVSCCDGECGDKDSSYCKNASIDDNSLPVSESKWELDNLKYPEPLEPLKPNPIVYQEYPTLTCQDCSSYIQSVDS